MFWAAAERAGTLAVTANAKFEINPELLIEAINELIFGIPDSRAPAGDASIAVGIPLLAATPNTADNAENPPGNKAAAL